MRSPDAPFPTRLLRSGGSILPEVVGAVVAFAVGLALAWLLRHGLANESGATGAPSSVAAVPRREPATNSIPATRRRSPREIEALFQAGLAAFRSGRNDEALERFREVAALDPRDPRPYHGLGLVYRERVLHERAEAAFRRASELDPGDPFARLELARALHDLARHDEARALLEKLLADRPGAKRPWPKESEIRGELALELLALGHPAEALSNLEAYRAEEGPGAWVLAHIGRAHEEVGRAAEAERFYREAVRADPAFTSAWYWLGQLLVREGRDAEGAEALARHRALRSLETKSHELRLALIRNPDDRQALINLAEARARLGKPDEALPLLDRALALDPSDARLAAIRANVARAVAARNAQTRSASGAPNDASSGPSRGR